MLANIAKIWIDSAIILVGKCAPVVQIVTYHRKTTPKSGHCMPAFEQCRDREPRAGPRVIRRGEWHLFAPANPMTKDTPCPLDQDTVAAPSRDEGVCAIAGPRAVDALPSCAVNVGLAFAIAP